MPEILALQALPADTGDPNVVHDSELSVDKYCHVSPSGYSAYLC